MNLQEEFNNHCNQLQQEFKNNCRQLEKEYNINVKLEEIRQLAGKRVILTPAEANEIGFK